MGACAHSKDEDLLRMIQSYFGGIGILSVTGSKVLWRVLSVKELMIITDHFDKYPLITKKRLDFLLFKEALQLFILKEHLTTDSLIKMASIKASFNKGLSINLKEAFPTAKIIDPPCLPSKGLIDVKEGKSINPFWIGGFTEAEGCFLLLFKRIKLHTK